MEHAATADHRVESHEGVRQVGAIDLNAARRRVVGDDTESRLGLQDASDHEFAIHLPRRLAEHLG